MNKREEHCATIFRLLKAYEILKLVVENTKRSKRKGSSYFIKVLSATRICISHRYIDKNRIPSDILMDDKHKNYKRLNDF